ncbi:hypothetical protein ALP85_102491 [Pseudomonas syringae pv. syringae]|nr:hypothetical protein ALP85_102491 [Pseudomonas syringae pv. syringae]
MSSYPEDSSDCTGTFVSKLTQLLCTPDRQVSSYPADIQRLHWHLREQARSHKCGVHLTGRRGSGEITAPEDLMACADLVGASLLAKRPAASPYQSTPTNPPV